jgi:hypothetical protein
MGMRAAIWNLVAAVLCTIAAAITTVALYLSEHTLVNLISLGGGVLGTLGGIAWIIAARDGV